MTYEPEVYGYLGILAAWSNACTNEVDPSSQALQHYIWHTQAQALGFESPPHWMVSQSQVTMRASLAAHGQRPPRDHEPHESAEAVVWWFGSMLQALEFQGVHSALKGTIGFKP